MITFKQAKKQLSGAWATSLLILNDIPPFYWEIWREKVLKPEEALSDEYDYLFFLDATKGIGDPSPDGKKIMTFTKNASDSRSGIKQIVVGWQITKEDSTVLVE